MFDADAAIRPWWERLLADAGGELALFDAHTHIGANDPDGYKQSPEELLAAMTAAGARAVVFPMHEPDGYREANDRAIDAARGSTRQNATRRSSDSSAARSAASLAAG